MPPKQATLGYVRSSQQTLGCTFRGYSVTRNLADIALFDSKFFGIPQGAKSKPQQSTLAFNSTQSSKAETPQGPKAEKTNGSIIENGTDDAKKQEDDGDIELGDNPGILETASKEPVLKTEKSKSSRDKTLSPIESKAVDEDRKDDEGV